MKWVTDRTGRFPKRPHYLREEIDSECEDVLSELRKSIDGKIAFPVTTDDLTVLIESRVEDLDLFADLSAEEGHVEGVTEFYPGRRPRVRISEKLTSDPRMVNRLRTTLTHEFGHVVFHSFLLSENPQPRGLFGETRETHSKKCKRENILGASERDWMEWQAGYACGAFLMPHTELKQLIRSFIEVRHISVGRFATDSKDGELLVSAVCHHFSVSRDAARVRLSQMGAVQESAGVVPLF